MTCAGASTISHSSTPVREFHESITVAVIPASYFENLIAVAPTFEALTGVKLRFEKVPPGQIRQKAMLDFALKVCKDAGAIGDEDFAALAAHGFSAEDAWDIWAIAAFFALSNRMANLISMRPNDEFYLLGRVPKT